MEKRAPSQLMVGPTSLTVSDRREVKAVVQCSAAGQYGGNSGPRT